MDRKARAKKVKDSIERRKERFEKGITPEKNPNHNKRKRVATRDAATEDESDKEVPDFAAGTGTFGRTKKSRKTSHTENTGTSRKRKTSETDWEDEAFVDELGADGDDEVCSMDCRRESCETDQVGRRTPSPTTWGARILMRICISIKPSGQS